MDLKQRSIADRTHTCLESFNALIHALETRSIGHGDELSLLAVEDQIGRFRLWAGNLGALQEGRSSLDYRLRDAKFIAENVRRLLDSLQASLIGATHAAGRPALARENSEDRSRGIPSDYETSSESSGGSDLEVPGQSELAGYYLTITEIIGRLFKLSIATRSPSVQNAATRSASFIEKDEEGNDLSVLFEQYVLQRIVHHYPELSPRIAERLSRAIGRRRRQFMYQRRHREKLGRAPRGERQSATLTQIVETDNLKSSVPNEAAVSISEAYVTTGLERSVFHHSILSETTATQYVPRPEQPQTPSTKSFSTASGVFQGSEIDIPPPVSPDKDQEFECPYCFFILSSEFKEQRTWRKHVFDDLEPYSCLFEDCPTPDQTFDKYKEWVYHEDWSHNLQWCCDLTSHDLQLFDSPAKLKEHLQEMHNEDVGEAGLRQLIERNQRPAPILWTECPFCKFVPDLSEVAEVSTGYSNDELASKRLVKHIGHHLQSISTLALPWRNDLMDDASSELNESAKARDREAGSQLDASEVGETNDDDETDLMAYELDVLTIPLTENQQWDMDPADFEEIDKDDPIIQHLLFNHTNDPARSENDQSVMNTLETLSFVTSTEQPNNSKYQYTPLNLGCIRLLHLYPGEPGQPIYCDLLIASLHHLPAYTYLSYTWGASIARVGIQMEAPTAPVRIRMGGQSCAVVTNLFAALMAIRSGDSTLTIWVDALCINQIDVLERHSQAQLMLQIAQSASETIVWLGESTEDSDLAMSFVSHYDDIVAKGLTRDEILALNKALISLFVRPWWSRVWMVQEVITSSSVVVICGSSSTPFEKFVDLRKFQLPQELQRDFQSVIQPIEQMPFGDLLWLWDQLRLKIFQGRATLFSLMMAMRKLQSTDPRDKVYSALALCRKNDRSFIPDYSQSYLSIYTEAMQLFLRNEGILPLYLVEEHQPTESSILPSWVIDWSVSPLPRAGFAFDGQGARRAYRSCGLPKDQEKFFGNRITFPAQVDKDGFFCRGILLDTISRRCTSLEYTGADTISLVLVCRNWRSVYLAGLRDIYADIESGQEAFWRTLVANRLENFAEEPTIDFFKDFKSLLEEEEEEELGFSFFPKKGHPDDRVEALIRRSCETRTFAMTERGYPALVPERARVGDIVCVLLGGDVPFVLRRGEENYTIIGEAYIHGFMDGKALELVEDGEKYIEDFSIC